MVQANKDTLKQALKEALVETLHEQRDMFREVFTEALEDLALAGAIHEGWKTKKASREDVFRILRGRQGTRSPSS